MIKILIVDNNEIARIGLKQVVAEQPDMKVAGEASTEREAINLVKENDYNIAIIDFSRTERRFLDFIVKLKALNPNLSIMISSIYSERHFAVWIFRVGGSGYLKKYKSGKSCQRDKNSIRGRQICQSDYRGNNCF